MKSKYLPILFICLFAGQLFHATGQNPKPESLPVQYEEIAATDFQAALDKAGEICIIPLGILEKHGPHLPLGTDLFLSREIALRAAALNYCMVFPEYYFGQIFEAKHQPGTIAYSPELVWNILRETCDELSRNGVKKIILVNGHGGNNHFLSYFCQSQLASRKDYVVVFFQPSETEELVKKLSLLKTTDYGGHADEDETSMMTACRPDLVHPGLASTQSGKDQKRMAGIPYAYTGIWWYASFPNHYAGDGSQPQAGIGNLIMDEQAQQLASLIEVMKKDDRIRELQDAFYMQSENPLKTPQGK